MIGAVRIVDRGTCLAHYQPRFYPRYSHLVPESCQECSLSAELRASRDHRKGGPPTTKRGYPVELWARERTYAITSGCKGAIFCTSLSLECTISTLLPHTSQHPHPSPSTLRASQHEELLTRLCRLYYLVINEFAYSFLPSASATSAFPCCSWKG